MLRRRERWQRREERRRLSWWDALLIAPVLTVFVAGAYLIPRTGSRWIHALLYLGLGVLIMALVLVATRIVARVRGRESPRSSFPLEYAFLLTGFFVVDALFPKRLWGDQGLAIVVQSVVTACILTLPYWLAQRRKRLARTAGHPAPGAP